MTGLREQLGAARLDVPGFTLSLPPGWEVTDVDEESAEGILARVRARLRDAHEPEAYAALAAQWPIVTAAMADAGVLAFAAPGPDAPEYVAPAASITLGASSLALHSDLSTYARAAAAGADLVSIGAVNTGDQIALAWRGEDVSVIGDERVGVSTTTYVVAWPSGTHLLTFTAALTHEDGLDAEGRAARDAWMAMMDSCLATFAWA